MPCRNHSPPESPRQANADSGREPESNRVLFRRVAASNQSEDLAPRRDLVGIAVLASDEMDLSWICVGANQFEMRKKLIEAFQESSAVLVRLGREDREASTPDPGHRVHFAHVLEQGLAELADQSVRPCGAESVLETLEPRNRAKGEQESIVVPLDPLDFLQNTRLESG